VKRSGRPNVGRPVAAEASNRSPRTDWTKPRSVADVIAGLERNGFIQSRTSTRVGIAFVRVCGQMALRVTIANALATLETAQRAEGGQVSWRLYRDPIGSQPWQVAREALELLATLDVDTPVRWG
jgi:hypothetical protein